MKNKFIPFAIILSVLSLINREMVPGGLDYVLFALFFIYETITLFGRGGKIENSYVFELILLFFLFILNYFVTPYAPSILMFLFASFVTFIPFLTYIVSARIQFGLNDMYRFSDAYIKTAFVVAIIVVVETAINPSNLSLSHTLLRTRLFMIGYLASYFSVTVVLCFLNYRLTGLRKYIIYLLFFSIMTVLTMQLKAIAGLLIVIFLYVVFFAKMSRFARFFSALVTMAGVVALLSLSSSFSQKVIEYAEIYGEGFETTGIARIELYRQSINMAKDFFPLGTGQGTFGSIPAKITRSAVYHDYDLDGVWGLSFNGPVSFIMDTHWASVLGEQGVIGLIIYLLLIITPLKRLKKLRQCDNDIRKLIQFVVIAIYSVILLDSFFLPLPNRLCFIFLYSGLCVLITNDYFIEDICSVEDNNEDVET